MLKNKLVSNFLHLVSLQGLTFILPLITMPYLFRVLGAEKFGLVAFALATINIFRVLVDYGFHLTSTRDISLNKDNNNKLIEIYSNTILTKLILFAMTFMVLNILIVFIDKFTNNWLLFYETFLFVLGYAIFPTWFFQGIEEMKYISYLNIIAKILFISGVFLFIKSPSDYMLYPLFNGLSIIIIALYSIFLIYKKYNIKLVWQPLENIRKTLKDGWNIFVGEFSLSLNSNFITILLGFTTTMDGIGYFSLANRIINISTTIMNIIRNVTFPYLNRNFDKFKIITIVMIGVGSILAISIFSLSPILLPFIFGDKIMNSLMIIYILALSPILYAFIYSFGSTYLLIQNEDKEYKKNVIIISILNIFLALVLIPTYGIYGGAITIIIIRFFLAFLHTRSSLKLRDRVIS